MGGTNGLTVGRSLTLGCRKTLGRPTPPPSPRPLIHPFTHGRPTERRQWAGLRRGFPSEKPDFEWLYLAVARAIRHVHKLVATLQLLGARL